MDIQIKHEPAERRFVAIVDGSEAEITYRQVGDKLNFFHTYVPPSARNRGLAAQLAETALKYARDNGFKVIPSCPYVSWYMDKHPEWNDLLS